MNRKLAGLLVACCLTLPLNNVIDGSAATTIKPNKVATMIQVTSKQLSGALKDAYTTNVRVSRKDTKTQQVQQFTIPSQSTVAVYCGFYRPTLFNFNVGVYTDVAGKNRVQGGYASKVLGDTSAEMIMELPAGTYYVIAEEIYRSQYKEDIQQTVTTTTGSAVVMTTETKQNPETVTNEMYIGVSYLPKSDLVKHTVTHAGGLANITVDARAASKTYESDIVALQYAKGLVSESSDIWVNTRTKAVDPESSTDDCTIVLPTKSRQSGTKVFKLDLTGTYTFRICVSNGTNLQTYTFNAHLDCTPPAVEGVEDGKIYREAVTVTGKDPEGSLVTYTLNGKPYTAGTPITENGKYRLVAKDYNGNVTRCKFTLRIRKAADNG